MIEDWEGGEEIMAQSRQALVQWGEYREDYREHHYRGREIVN